MNSQDNTSNSDLFQFFLSKGKDCLNALLNMDDSLIFILNSDGRMIHVNIKGAELLHYPPGSLIGKHCLDLVSNDEKFSFIEKIKDILSNDRSITFDILLLNKAGFEENFTLNMKTVQSDAEKFVICIANKVEVVYSLEKQIIELNERLIESNRIIDIENNRSKEPFSILDELNRLKNEFVSNISHELRTPLASIIGFSETMSMDPEMPPEMRNEFTSIILSEGKRLAKLINDILDLSKLEVGQLDLNKTEFDIVELLYETIITNNKYASDRKLTLNYQLPNEEVFVYADKDRIFQIFNGLLNNAIKFTNEGGRVFMSAKSLFKEFEVTISDTGIGIPQKDIPFIFQKFYRVSRPGTEIPGTGLGLVFVKRLVDLHKGLITVKSEINKGSTFMILLPKTNYSNKLQDAL